MGLGNRVILEGYSGQWVGKVDQPARKTLICYLSAEAEMRGREAWDVLWGLGPRDWGSLAGRLRTHLFQLVQAVLMSLGSAALEPDIWPVGG